MAERVALLGYGIGGAAFHAPLIDATPGLRLAAIVTGDPARAADAGGRYPDARIVPDADRLWRMAGELDAVVISTPNRTHVPLAMAALDAGLHVVVDKPLAPSAAEARALIEHARRAERVLTVYQNRRWDGDFLTLRRLVDAGELGEVHRMESRFERWRPEPKPGWRQDPDPAAGGGLLYDLGAHLIDQALVLFGPAREVYAELDARRPGVRVDDDAFVALTHASGVRSHLWMNVIAATPAPRFRVLGSRATWTAWGMDPQEAELRSSGALGDAGHGAPDPPTASVNEGAGPRPAPLDRGDYGGFYTELERALRAGGPPPVDPADAVATLEVIEAARRYGITSSSTLAP